MWVLSVWPKGASGSVDLMFVREEKARAYFNELRNSIGGVEVIDDFGTSFLVRFPEAHDVRLVDYEKSLTAQTQLTVLQTRAQAKAQTAAMNDPAVRFATQGPANLIRS